MATEALKRLREEIDAAFQAQRRPSTSQRVEYSVSKALTPRWGQVTALLASVDRPSVKKSTFNLQEHTVGTFRGQIKEQTLHQLTADEKLLLLRKFMIQWRRIAHASAVISRLHSRSRRRRERRLTATVFMEWKRILRYQFKVKAARNSVEKQTRIVNIAVAWRKWTGAHCRAVKIREFCEKRRVRVSCEAFCTWILAANQRRVFRRYKRKAVHQLLRRYWRWLKSAIKRQRMVHDQMKLFLKRRMVNLTQHWFLLWIEYVEQRKQWQFAVQWSEKRMLGDAYDTWRWSHEDTRRVRHTLQLATRRQRRRKLRQVVKMWRAHAQRVMKQKRALETVIHSQLRRNVFMKLTLSTQYDREREKSFQDWKMRLTMWKWLNRSHRDRMLRLRAEFLKENHERLIMRNAAWRPWRRSYFHSVALQRFSAKQRAKRLRKCWDGLVFIVNQQEMQRLMVESLADTREVRELHRAICVWRVQARVLREDRDLEVKSAGFYRHGLLKKTIFRWKAVYHVACKDKNLDTIAVRHLVGKMVQHWAKWAYWSKRELGARISIVKKRRQRRQLQHSVSHWKERIHARHQVLCGKIFRMWKLGIDVQHQQGQLQELQRFLLLRWRWKRWRMFILQCQNVRSKADQARKQRDKRLLREYFITVWLHKTRRYKLGSNIVSKVTKNHVLSCALSRWRQKQQQMRVIGIAVNFHRKKLSTRCLRLLFELTVGLKRSASAYYRRHHLMRAWSCWFQYFTLKRRRYEASVYFHRRSKRKAVRLLHFTAVNSISRRNQRLDAEAWHEAVVLQRFLVKWLAAAQHSRHCRSLGKRLAWNIVGRRVFRVWQDELTEKQKLLKAAEFHSSVLVTRSWNALLRVTKRRQLALIMWSHSMTQFRLNTVFTIWKHFIHYRRGQYAVTASMCRMQEQRLRQSLFTAWVLLITTRRMAIRREQREMLRWRQVSFAHWKLWRVSCRWQRTQQLIVLSKVFSQGLKRYAIQQQARREICIQTARNLLYRSLAQWRLEWWLALNHKKLVAETKRNALKHWTMFVSACRQKRRWELYVQQLHHLQTRSKTSAFDQTGGTFRKTRVLQAQLKRNRVLMTHVLHAWYLVVQTCRRRRGLALSEKVGKRSRFNTRKIALRFWARQVLAKCFFAWQVAAADASWETTPSSALQA